MDRIVWLLAEGAHDTPQRTLDGRTPLQVARCAAAGRLAAEGTRAWLLPPRGAEGWRPETLMGVLCGMTPAEAELLRPGPLEAEAAGADLADCTFAYAAQFVALDGGVVRDAAVGGLRPEEVAALRQALQGEFDPHLVRFEALADGRLVALVRSHTEDLDPGVPPWLAEQAPAEEQLPRGRRGEIVRRVFERSEKLLARHPINEVRVDLGENPATHLWLWGGGRPLRPATLNGGRPCRGVVAAGSTLAAGFARAAGMAVLPLADVWAADGAPLEAAALARAAAEADVIGVHAGPPRAGGRYGTPVDKVRLLERLDVQVIRPLIEALEQMGSCRLALVSADAGPCPLILWTGGGAAADPVRWEEAAFAGAESVPAAEVFERLRRITA